MSSFADTESLCLISFKPLTFHRRFGAPFSGHLMTALDRTAYPRLGERLTREELDARYRPWAKPTKPLSVPPPVAMPAV